MTGPLETGPTGGAPPAAAPFDAELIAVVAAVTARMPRVLTLETGRSLPSGPFESAHRSLQSGVRSWVERQTHHPLGHIEQLYTFADRDRLENSGPRRVISVSYLALTLESRMDPDPGVGWWSWYRYFPWEDHRQGPPPVLGPILDALERWASHGATAAERRMRRGRCRHAFRVEGHGWNEEWVLQRYELLYEASLIAEARRRNRDAANGGDPLRTGEAMVQDHRRILATAIARLRAKIKYRPVVFELLPPSFTYLELQQAVEAIAGLKLHKQNFRRLMIQQKLVEPTGTIESRTGGRPARRYRFRRDVLMEQAPGGSRLPQERGGRRI
jgi:hypothetical protein